MKVLSLPYNIASIPYHTIKALEKKGVSCKSLFVNFSNYQKYPIENSIILNIDTKSKFMRFFNKLRYYKKLQELVDWADLIHWTFGNNVAFLTKDIDLRIIKKSRKPSLIEWLGSDIRIAEIEEKENRYYKKALEEGYEYKNFEKKRLSIQRQRKFKEFGFNFAVIRGVEKFVDKSIVENYYLTDLRISLDEFPELVPNFSDKLLVVHSPSAIIAKGTKYVIDVVKRLKKRYNFDFELINGKNRKENLEVLKNADIYLDQFILGHYGMAAIEAMAYGKPVLCYLKEQYYRNELKNIPIINTTIETLEENLKLLFENPQLVNEIGKKSRQFVYEMHDADNWAQKFINIYSELIAKNEEKLF